jgi:DNA-binding FadR family transcriptional regulator
MGKAELAELDQTERLRHVLGEHKAIYQAIVRQDSDDARAAMRMHLSNSRERLRQVHKAA